MLKESTPFFTLGLGCHVDPVTPETPLESACTRVWWWGGAAAATEGRRPFVTSVFTHLAECTMSLIWLKYCLVTVGILFSISAVEIKN